jgi:hypothetical protein
MLYRFLNQFLKRLIAGDSVADGSAASLRNVIVWLFIAVVATFLTHPAGGPPGASSVSSVYDRPVPWPAELGLDNRFGI